MPFACILRWQLSLFSVASAVQHAKRCFLRRQSSALNALVVGEYQFATFWSPRQTARQPFSHGGNQGVSTVLTQQVSQSVSQCVCVRERERLRVCFCLPSANWPNVNCNFALLTSCQLIFRTCHALRPPTLVSAHQQMAASHAFCRLISFCCI